MPTLSSSNSRETIPSISNSRETIPTPTSSGSKESLNSYKVETFEIKAKELPAPQKPVIIELNRSTIAEVRRRLENCNIYLRNELN